MLKNEFARFLSDERGGYTIWSLVWFIMYVAIGGLAVDITDVFRNQNWLQATADSAALAGVMSLGTKSQDPVQAAVVYARGNMNPGRHGIVLNDTDVVVGTWHFDGEWFEPETAEPNAVYVTTRKSTDNGNPVTWSLLRILSLAGANPWWNVKAEAVAVAGVDVCHNHGMLSLGQQSWRSHTNFQNHICLIPQEAFLLAAGGQASTGFDDTVYVGVGCGPNDNGCVGSGQVPWSNEDFLDAFDSDGAGTGNYKDGTLPANAMKLDKYINDLMEWADPDYGEQDVSYEDLDDLVETQKELGVDYSGWEYLAHPDDKTVSYQPVPSEEVPALPETLQPYTVYEVSNCEGGLEIPQTQTDIENVAIVTDCPIDLGGGTYSIKNSLIVTTYASGEGNGNYGLKGGANVDLGTDCNNGIELYVKGNMHFASGATISGSRILTNGNRLHFAANPNGPAGIHIETTGEIFQASGSAHQSYWGLCSGVPGKGPTVLTYALVR